MDGGMLLVCKYDPPTIVTLERFFCAEQGGAGIFVSGQMMAIFLRMPRPRYMMFATPMEEYKVNPVAARAINAFMILHMDHDA